MMVMTDQLMAVARAYCAAGDCDLPRASRLSLGDQRILPGIEVGSSSVTLRRADRALRWFSDHWPEGASWPSSVPRPPALPVSQPSAGGDAGDCAGRSVNGAPAPLSSAEAAP